MTFKDDFTPLERIQLLQRSILVNSMAYYELNDNILSDFQYDANARQLEDLMKECKDDARKSRYSEYFKDFFSEENGTHMTSGFDLLERVRKSDPELYRYLRMDTYLALELKEEKYEKI